MNEGRKKKESPRLSKPYVIGNFYVSNYLTKSFYIIWIFITYVRPFYVALISNLGMLELSYLIKT